MQRLTPTAIQVSYLKWWGALLYPCPQVLMPAQYKPVRGHGRIQLWAVSLCVCLEVWQCRLTVAGHTTLGLSTDTPNFGAPHCSYIVSTKGKQASVNEYAALVKL